MKDTKTRKADISAQQTKDIKSIIKLINAVDNGKAKVSKFIEMDITENGGQMILLTAQHLCIKTPSNSFKNCKTLNSLSRAVKRVTADDANELEPVKITRTDKKAHICELLPNMKAEKEFSTFEEIAKLLNRTEGKTANNLNEKQTQELIQFLGKTIS
jgi:hypothetical protein